MSTGAFAELYTKMSEAQKQVGGTPIKVTTATSVAGPMTMTVTQLMQNQRHQADRCRREVATNSGRLYGEAADVLESRAATKKTGRPVRTARSFIAMA